MGPKKGAKKASRGAKWSSETRPEAAGAADAHYDEEEAARYTETNQSSQIQKDLTLRALQLLGLQAGRPALLADVGCGSGLSGRELTEAGHAWVGTDISAAMLQLGAAADACRGRLCLGDMAHGLPLRAGALDGAVSVSAVQWLCAREDGRDALARLFHSLMRCLKPGACAALQVYPKDDGQASLLLSSALGCGFQAGLFVDFPHPTAAKKFYLCLRSPGSQGSAPGSAPSVGAGQAPERGGAGSSLSAHCCNLAWPKTGSCALRWLGHLQTLAQRSAASPGSDAATPPEAGATGQQAGGGGDAGARLHQEHATHAKRVLRLLRRAMANAAAATERLIGAAAAGDAGGGGAGSEAEPAGIPAAAAGSPLLAAEAEVVASLLPCGGSIAVYATLPEAEMLSIMGARPPMAAAAAAAAASRSEGGPEQAAAEAPPPSDPPSNAAAAWVASWMGPGCSVRACRVQPAKPAPQVPAKRSTQQGGQAEQQEREVKRARGSNGQPAAAPVAPAAQPAPGAPAAGAQHEQEPPPQQQQGKARGPPPSTDQFFWYRALATLPLEAPAGAGADGELTLGLLWQLKAPTHLVLTTRGPTVAPAAGVAGAAGSSSGAGRAVAEALRAAAEGVERVCGRLGGCLVGCDVSRGRGGELLSSWVVYTVPGGVAEEGDDTEKLTKVARECFGVVP